MCKIVSVTYILLSDLCALDVTRLSYEIYFILQALGTLQHSHSSIKPENVSSFINFYYSFSVEPYFVSLLFLAKGGSS